MEKDLYCLKDTHLVQSQGEADTEVNHSARKPRFLLVIEDYWQIIVDMKYSRETTRYISVVLIGSDVHSIVTYLLSGKLRQWQ